MNPLKVNFYYFALRNKLLDHERILRNTKEN